MVSRRLDEVDERRFASGTMMPVPLGPDRDRLHAHQQQATQVQRRVAFAISGGYQPSKVGEPPVNKR
jgi:hypothetical protein